MRDRRRTTIAALAGGVALASAGFAIGSQTGDGDANARSGARSAGTADVIRLAGPGGPGFESLADRLGVSEARLREALDDLRPSKDDQGELAEFLAKALGIERAKVDAALTDLRAQHERRHEADRNAHADALAKELGIDASKVRAAFDDLKPPALRRDGRPPDPRTLLADMAMELGVTQAKLRAALREVGPGGPGRRGGPDERRGPGPVPHHHHPRGGGPGFVAPGFGGPGGPRGAGGPMADDLAKALGVDADRVEQALEDFHEQRHDQFAQKLADALGIGVDKVRDALPPRP